MRVHSCDSLRTITGEDVMGWDIGFDSRRQRDIGYGVPAFCDHPDCNEKIDRGLGHVCCNEEPYGGEEGCGLFFCHKHCCFPGKCERCAAGQEPFDATADHPDWIRWKLIDESWQSWRDENPDKVAELKAQCPTS